MVSGQDNIICFVISPIGGPDTPVRKRSDQVFKHVFEPAAEQCGFKAIRADHISEPGLITSQIIQHIIEDPIVLGDLTGRNPNVFYELAIRHALRKPYVQLIEKGEEIPFDVAGVRTITVDHHDLDSVEAAKEEIVRQMQSMQSPGYEVQSPISAAVDLESLRQSGSPQQRQLADLHTSVADLRTGFSTFEATVSSVIIELAETLKGQQPNHRTVFQLSRDITRVQKLIGALGRDVPPLVSLEQARELLLDIEKYLTAVQPRVFESRLRANVIRRRYIGPEDQP